MPALRSLRPLGAVLLIAAVAAGAVWLRTAKAPRFPRAPIVLISIDTLRADAVAGFGAPILQTPNLYILGEEGVRFETAIAAAHLTAPSHASMLTGYSPHVHGVAMGHQGKAWSIPESIPTLAEILKREGYRTAAFTDGIQLLPEGGFARGFDLYNHETKGLVVKLDEIGEFLDAGGDAPPFLFFHTYRPHQPYRPPLDLMPELVKNYRGAFAAAAREVSWMTHRDVMTPSEHQAKVGAQLAGSRATTDEDRLFFRRLYNAAVTDADREVGAVLQLLRDKGLYDRAVIAVTSDHGESFFEHGLDSHNTIYDECIRVPMIVRMPGAAAAGRRIAATFPAVNLVPTLLELGDAGKGLTFEGKSVAERILRGEPEERPAFSAWFYGSDERLAPGLGARVRGAKHLQWKSGDKDSGSRHHKILDMARRFFDLDKDPRELSGHDEGATALDRELVLALRAAEDQWAALRERFGVGGVAATDLSEDAQNAMRAVGYVGGR
jgi:arylsulfatase A-like enzyme